jgi:hypothetical protein
MLLNVQAIPTFRSCDMCESLFHFDYVWLKLQWKKCLRDYSCRYKSNNVSQASSCAIFKSLLHSPHLHFLDDHGSLHILVK